jgi:ribonuclease HI
MDDRSIPRGVAAPPSGPVVVHFDGACEGGHGGSIATYGFVVEGPGLRYEDRGLAVPPFHERATNNVAEYVAAIYALEWLLGTRYDGEVVLEGDSQLVIRQMTGEYEVKAEHLRPYRERLLQLASRFRRVEYRWVPREENARADALSKEALTETRRELGAAARRRRVADREDDYSDGAPGGPQRTV